MPLLLVNMPGDESVYLNKRADKEPKLFCMFFFFRDEQGQTILSKVPNVYVTNRTFQDIFVV